MACYFSSRSPLRKDKFIYRHDMTNKNLVNLKFCTWIVQHMFEKSYECIFKKRCSKCKYARKKDIPDWLKPSATAFVLIIIHLHTRYSQNNFIKLVNFSLINYWMHFLTFQQFSTLYLQVSRIQFTFYWIRDTLKREW